MRVDPPLDHPLDPRLDCPLRHSIAIPPLTLYRGARSGGAVLGGAVPGGAVLRLGEAVLGGAVLGGAVPGGVGAGRAVLPAVLNLLAQDLSHQRLD